MTDDDVRSQFRAFVGEERFRQMIFKTVNTLGTDYFAPWDYDLWLSFQTKCAAAPTDVQDIRRLLLWCHVHERPLVTDQLARRMFPRRTLKAVTHSSRTSEWYEAARQAFPHGHGGLDVICPGCITAHLEWLAAHPNWRATPPAR
jgi:hypothetical protein